MMVFYGLGTRSSFSIIMYIKGDLKLDKDGHFIIYKQSNRVIGGLKELEKVPVGLCISEESWKRKAINKAKKLKADCVKYQHFRRSDGNVAAMFDEVAEVFVWFRE